MDKISMIGLDLAKNVFQVHGVDATGQVVVRRQLRRAEVIKFFSKPSPCLVGMEACGSAHYSGLFSSDRGESKIPHIERNRTARARFRIRRTGKA